MEDIGRIVAGFVGGIASDEGIRYATRERPPSFAAETADEMTVIDKERGPEGGDRVLEKEFITNYYSEGKAIGSVYNLYWVERAGHKDLEAIVSIFRDRIRLAKFTGLDLVISVWGQEETIGKEYTSIWGKNR